MKMLQAAKMAQSAHLLSPYFSHASVPSRRPWKTPFGVIPRSLDERSPSVGRGSKQCLTLGFAARFAECAYKQLRDKYSACFP